MALRSHSADRKPDPPARSGGIATDRSPDFSLPLRYFGLGIAAYLLATLGVAAVGPALAGTPWHPQVIALTHVMTLGVLVGMIMGASYQMVPVVLLAPIWSQGLGKGSFWVFLPGVAAMVAGFALGKPAWLGVLLRVGATLAAAGAGVWAWDARGMFAGRIRKKLDAGLTYTATAIGWLVLAALMGLVLAWGLVPPGIPADRWAIAYAVVGMVGFIGFTVIGQFYKIMPFLAWYHRYSSLVGKTKVPLIKDIYDEKIAWYGFWAAQAGLALALASILAGVGGGIRAAGVLLALGALAAAVMTVQTLKR
jgi:hypothetical protein